MMVRKVVKQNRLVWNASITNANFLYGFAKAFRFVCAVRAETKLWSLSHAKCQFIRCVPVAKMTITSNACVRTKTSVKVILWWFNVTEVTTAPKQCSNYSAVIERSSFLYFRIRSFRFIFFWRSKPNFVFQLQFKNRNFGSRRIRHDHMCEKRLSFCRNCNKLSQFSSAGNESHLQPASHTHTASSTSVYNRP